MADDTNTENTDSSNGTETVDTESTGAEGTDEGAESSEELTVAELQVLNKKLFERAKKAEGFEKQSDGSWVKKAKPIVKPQAEQTQQTSSSPVDVDERILKAQGMAPELLKQLKDIAKLRGVSLIDAQTDDLFVAVKTKFDKDQAHNKASVGASRGSGAVKVRKTLATPGLTREEHMALVRGE